MVKDPKVDSQASTEESEEQKQAREKEEQEESAENKLYPDGSKKEGEESAEEKEAREKQENKDKDIKDLSDRAEKVGLKPEATKEEVEAAEKQKEEEARPKSIEELHEAAIAATEKWQAEPTPENKKLAQDALAVAKKAIADGKKAEIKYDVKLPENTLLPKERVEEIVAYARERGFSNDVAQALVERENQAVVHHQEGIMRTADELINVTWVNEAVEDKEIGGDDFPKNAELAKRVLLKFAPPEFIKVLDNPSEKNPEGKGFGNHPGLLKTFVRIGKIMADDQLILPKNKGDGEKDLADVFYGGDKSKDGESKE